jgi:Flp pilus assembly pilin Flp
MNIFIMRAYLQARFATHDERGANLVEYLLLVAFIAVVVLGAVKLLGGTVDSRFSQANTDLK